MKRVAVLSCVILILILAGCGGGAAKQTAPKPAAKRDPAISRSFKIADRSMFLQCRGSGSPTIVMDAGMGNDHGTWDGVARPLSKLTRTCTYDRAGEGLSDPEPGPRTSRDIVSDLRRLLARAGVAPPYVLAAHSWGGINMRLFAGEYHSEIVGLVLVDATPTTLLDDACKISKLMCTIFVSSLDWQRNPEAVRFERSAHQVDATRLGHIPLIVMTATNHADPSLSARANRIFEAQWQRAQKRLAASVPGGMLEVVQGSHGIQDEHPRLVIAAISAVLKKTR